MIVVPHSRHLEGKLRDAMMDSTSTFRELSLYGRRVFVVDPFPKNGMVISPGEAMLIDGGLHARSLRPEGTIVDVNGIQIGGKRLVIAAGPCAVESEEQVMTVAENVKDLGADMLRGGAFKPRTSPYSFQGLGAEDRHYVGYDLQLDGQQIVTLSGHGNYVGVWKQGFHDVDGSCR